MDDILRKILQDCYTYTTLKYRLRVLREYFTFNLFAQKSNTELNPKDARFIESLGSEFLNQFNRENFESIFTEIENKISQFPILHIFLSFETNDNIDSQIGQSIQRLFGKTILFETRFDPSLIAGCALSWKGIYRDYSLKTKIDVQKPQIIQSFKKFLRSPNFN